MPIGCDCAVSGIGNNWMEGLEQFPDGRFDPLCVFESGPLTGEVNWRGWEPLPCEQTVLFDILR